MDLVHQTIFLLRGLGLGSGVTLFFFFFFFFFFLGGGGVLQLHFAISVTYSNIVLS